MTSVTDRQDSPDIEIPGLPGISEVQCLRIQNLFLQQQICQCQLNALTLQFLQTREPRALQERVDELTSQLNALADRMFAEYGVDSGLYQLDIERGVFRERKTTAAGA